MIAERISLGAIYKTLSNVESNEGKITGIVLDYRIGNKVISPPVFEDLNTLKSFINRNYPFIRLTGEDLICSWQPYMPIKFWVAKENGIQVQFKADLATTKGKLYKMSEKRLRELKDYINSIEGYINFDNYIAPSTPTYVECVYIDDILDDGGFNKANEEYKKYATL